MRMDSLFHTTSKNTFDEYKKYVLTLQKKRLILTISLLVVFFCIVGYFTKHTLFYVAAVIVPFLEYFSTVRPLKKLYYSNKLAVDAVLEYDFYDTYFTKKSVAGEDRIEYDKLAKIIETKTNFYLMLALNQGYMLKKEDMPKGLDEFIRKLKH